MRSRCRIAAARVLERLHLPGPADRHRRDLARLHLRLQLLLDHRDARPQLPHLRRRRASSPTSPMRARRGARAIFIVDDNITLNVARFEALCRAIIDAGLQRHPLPRAGDDLVDRQPRRDAGAADAARRLPLRVPRHRERARRGPRVPARVGEERAARGRTPRRQRDAARDRAAARRRHLRRRRHHRRQPRRHARVDRDEPGVRAALRGLAVHPASDAVSRHADDEGLPRAAA